MMSIANAVTNTPTWRRIAHVRRGIVASLILAFGSSAAFAQSSPVCGVSAPVDVVLMFDTTGSISSNTLNAFGVDDLQQQRLAGKAFLNYFAGRSDRPRVSIGTFSVPSGQTNNTTPTPAARIVSGGAPSRNYASLASVIDTITTSGGTTDISEALAKGAGHLMGNVEDPLNPGRRFLVLLSDGTPNRPGASSYTECNVCGCPSAYSAAEVMAETARANHVEVLSVHYTGHGTTFTSCDATEPEKGIALMQTELSYLPDYFYSGAGNLTPAFERIAGRISCDDCDPCTIDAFDFVAGVCTHSPDTRDIDNDGRIDCSDADVCYGDDALLGEACQVAAGTCSYQGTFVCGENGAVQCGSSDSALAGCGQCTISTENSMVAEVCDTVEEIQAECEEHYRSLRAQKKTVSPSSLRRAAKLVRRARKIKGQANKIKVQRLNASHSCDASGLCVAIGGSLDRSASDSRLEAVKIVLRRMAATARTAGLSRTTSARLAAGRRAAQKRYLAQKQKLQAQGYKVCFK